MGRQEIVPPRLKVSVESQESTRFTRGKGPGRSFDDKVRASFELSCAKSRSCSVVGRSYNSKQDRFGARGKEWLRKKRSFSYAQGRWSLGLQAQEPASDWLVLSAAKLLAFYPPLRKNHAMKWSNEQSIDIDAGGLFRGAKVKARYLVEVQGKTKRVNFQGTISGTGKRAGGLMKLSGQISGYYLLSRDRRILRAQIAIDATRTLERRGGKAVVRVRRTLQASPL